LHSFDELSSFPATHVRGVTHVLEPLLDFVPGAQGAQEVLPAEAEKVFTAQKLHPLISTSKNCPEGQPVHIIAPKEVVVEPAAQGVQEVAPVEDEKVLNAQSSQETPLADDLPAGHTVHVADCTGAKEPAAQGVQEVAPVEDEVFAAQNSQETPLADDLPAGHTVHVADCAGAKVFSGHLVHTMLVLSLLYVLAGHGSHCPVE